ncbi:MAG: non-ribosomal peptide synthetase, partial [Myxococcales bacterium]|nr:non-ribosomal peptide synthetase [Myxococcales bacterium]
MTPEELLAALEARGATLTAVDGKLRLRAARGAVPSELQAQIAAQKAELLTLLTAPALPDEAFAPFPLTDVQEAYLVGGTDDFVLGGVDCHLYGEYERVGLDVARLAAAWQALVDHHAQLRTVVEPHGQRVLREVPPASIPVHDLRAVPESAREAALEAARTRLSNRRVPHGAWPMNAVEVSLLPGDRARVHVDFHLGQTDAAGLAQLFVDWGRLYGEPGLALPPPPLSFRDYVLQARAARGRPSWQASAAWWRERLRTLPPAPALPLAADPAAVSPPRFVRH